MEHTFGNPLGWDSVDLARVYAHHYHQGQFRRISGVPYIDHPAAVARMLKEHGDSVDCQVVGWLHDTLEDTILSYNEIRDVFGEYVAEGVRYLTRYESQEGYKRKILSAPREIQRVKIFDLIDNLTTIEHLKDQSIKKKVVDSIQFYIPLAEEVVPDLALPIEDQLRRYYNLKQCPFTDFCSDLPKGYEKMW